jgi:hypothetical protein
MFDSIFFYNKNICKSRSWLCTTHCQSIITNKLQICHNRKYTLLVWALVLRALAREKFLTDLIVRHDKNLLFTFNWCVKNRKFLNSIIQIAFSLFTVSFCCCVLLYYQIQLGFDFLRSTLSFAFRPVLRAISRLTSLSVH